MFSYFFVYCSILSLHIHNHFLSICCWELEKYKIEVVVLAEFKFEPFMGCDIA